jgi:hypothetical protein
MIGDRWGATDAEVAATRPCDALLSAGAMQADRAISIAAPPATVFRWLCQLRAAPYSYDLLDNFGRRSPRTLTPGLDELAPGQRFMSIFRLQSFAPGAHITLCARTTAVTYAVEPEGAGSRLVVRIRLAGSRLFARPLLLGDLVMMRRQLLTLKRHAERC